MKTSKTSEAPPAPSLESLAVLLEQLFASTSDPDLAKELGHGLVRELRYPIASFKQRFPDAWPTPQAKLF